MNTQSMLITAVLVIVAFGLGFLAGGTDRGVVVSETQTGNVSTAGLGGQNPQGSAGSGSPTGGDNSTGGTAVETADLSEGQRRLLAAFGVDADTVTITPAMIACAEAKLGAPRIEEIKNGATPTVTEGASLVACYRQ
jgi:hypothetical protein